MENSTAIIKSEIAFLFKEFKKTIIIYDDKVEKYLKNKYYFQDDDNINMLSKINFKYFNLAKEFRNFVLRYNVSHDYITESVLNDIIKRPIEYILYRKQSNYDSDSETASDDNEEISEEKSIDNNFQSIINKILKDSTINNKESMINDILNEKTTNNDKAIKNEKTTKNDNTYVETPIV